ncbi:MAG TPA: ABC transporter permease [Vicinamibacterales bacterium]|nr:ABC transporter permease [Vicinamibacterales bacterium]
MSRFLSDAKSAWRVMSRGRATTVFAVLAFALGTGITTAVFSLFYGVLIKPLPYPNPDELVVVYDTQPACSTCPASFEKYTEWRQRNQVFQAMGGSFNPLVVVTGLGDPERVQAVRATFTLLDVFQVHPEAGRWFTEAEDQLNGPNVVVLTDGYWRRRFNGDPGVIGRKLTIDDVPYEVIGIMPASFQHKRAELFMPVQRAYTPGNRGNHFLVTYARLKAGVTPLRAQKEMVALGATLAGEFKHNHGIDVQPYYDAVVGTVAGPLRILMGAVSFVLLIACANVANLLLASGLSRRREFAVRTALGATRGDLARQLVLESVLLALVGGALGLVLANWTVQGFVALADTALPRASTIGVDWMVTVFAIGVSLVTGLICGLWPVFRVNNRSIASDVRQGDLRSGTQGGRLGDSLVVVEIALAFSLLVGAGLFIKNLAQLESQDTGFSSEHVVAFDLAASGARYQDADRQKDFYRELLPRLTAVPRVSSVGYTSHLPMYQYGWNGEVTLESGNPWKPGDAPLVENRWIGGDYFKTMGIVLRRGRMFDDRDRASSTKVAILSEAAAKKFWPGQDPIGKRLSKGGPGNPMYEVVGVVHDVMSFGLTRKMGYELYVPIEQEAFGNLTVVMRTDAPDPTSVIPAARRAVADVDKDLPLSRVQTMTDVVSKSVTQPRLVSSLTSLFGALAGALAAVGVYGVMAYAVRRQRREFGIRMALGADPRRVRALVVRRGLILGGLGIAIGAVAALALTRMLQSLIGNVKPGDPAVFAGAALGLLLVTVLAGYLPARQASRTDPLVVLRVD